LTTLRDDLPRFLKELRPAPVGEALVPLGGQLLEELPQDPGFWLHYADACRERDDFWEAQRAVEEASRLIDEARNDDSPNPILDPVLDYLYWRKLQLEGELLKVLARGNPALQGHLVEVLRRLAALSYADICRTLEGVEGLEGDPSAPSLDTGNRWWRHAARVHHHSKRQARSGIEYQPDLLVIQDLATALMGAGRFQEAQQLFSRPPFTTFVPGNTRAERDLAWFPTLLGWLSPFLQHPLKNLTPFGAVGPRYVIGMVVWGEAFLDSLEQFPLPSLLAPGNLPYLQSVGDVRFLLFTTESGAERLGRMRALQEIRTFATVDIVTFPGTLTATKDTYKLMSSMHLAAMAVAKTAQSHFLFLAPDIILADNFLQVIDQRMQSGAEVVFVPGVMLQLETFRQEQAQCFPPVGGVISIPPKELLALGLRHLHPFVKQAYVYSPVNRRPSASVLMWPLKHEGDYLVHGFHHTPYLVSAQAMQRYDESLFFTIDGEFLLKIIRSKEELDACHLLTDLRETNYFELSKGNRFDFPIEFDMTRLCQWGLLQGPVATWLVRQKVRIASFSEDPQDPALKASTEVVEEILREMESLESKDVKLAHASTFPG